MSKRGENIYRRADGRWEGRYIVGYDPLSGKAKFGYLYADSYRKVRQLKREKIREGGFGKNQKNPGKQKTEKRQEPTVEMCLREWLEEKEDLRELRTSTLQLYRRQIRFHILPELRDCRISRLTENMLEEFKSRKLKSGRLDGRGGLSPSVVEGLMGILYAMLQYEWESGQMPELPRKRGEGARGVRRAAQKNQAFSEEEQRKIEAVLYPKLIKEESKRGIYMGILFAFYTGLRVGELGGLQWKDIDLENSTVTVRRTLQRIAAPEGGERQTAVQGENTRKTAMQSEVQIYKAGPQPRKQTRKTVLLLGPPKSQSSCRCFPVKEEMMAILRRYKKSLPKEQTCPDMPVFSSGAGCCVEPRLFQKYFAGLLAQAEVEKRKFHTLRHTFATRCMEKNMDVQSLSECLGHSGSNITLRVYTHSFAEHKRSCMKRLSFKCDIRTIESAPQAETGCTA